MSFYKFWGKLDKKGSFKLHHKDFLGFDLFSQLSHMSAIAIGDVTRYQIFEYASHLPYGPSQYFKEVHLLAQELNYDYAQACHLVGEKIEEEEMRSLFLRLSGALSSGESEADFLKREAEVQAESYTNEYERKLESLKKWTDAYSALIISAIIIVIIATISTVLWKMSTVLIYGLVGLTIGIVALGAWLIYLLSPREFKTLSSPESSPGQKLSRALGKFSLPLAILIPSFLAIIGVDLGWILIVASILLFPVGLISYLDDRKINKKDAEISTFFRTLGGAATAMGTTVTEALGKIDLRSISSLASQAKKLHIRLISNIKPELCWRKFVTENGSELINRSVGMFQDAVNLGGEPEEVGSRTSFFALRIALLRAKRTLISSSFRWLSFLMHAATIGLLVFVVEIMTTFGEAIESIKEALPGTSMPSSIPSLGFSFNFTGLELLQDLSVPVILVFTIVNALAPQVTDGGHKYKFFYYLGITLAISGALLIYVPKMAGMVFGVISI